MNKGDAHGRNGHLLNDRSRVPPALALLRKLVFSFELAHDGSPGVQTQKLKRMELQFVLLVDDHPPLDSLDGWA